MEETLQIHRGFIMLAISDVISNIKSNCASVENENYDWMSCNFCDVRIPTFLIDHSLTIKNLSIFKEKFNFLKKELKDIKIQIISSETFSLQEKSIALKEMHENYSKVILKKKEITERGDTIVDYIASNVQLNRCINQEEEASLISTFKNCRVIIQNIFCSQEKVENVIKLIDERTENFSRKNIKISIDEICNKVEKIKTIKSAKKKSRSLKVIKENILSSKNNNSLEVLNALKKIIDLEFDMHNKHPKIFNRNMLIISLLDLKRRCLSIKNLYNNPQILEFISSIDLKITQLFG